MSDEKFIETIVDNIDQAITYCLVESQTSPNSTSHRPPAKPGA